MEKSVEEIFVVFVVECCTLSCPSSGGMGIQRDEMDIEVQLGCSFVFLVRGKGCKSFSVCAKINAWLLDFFSVSCPPASALEMEN
jgi:hypothetical protein